MAVGNRLQRPDAVQRSAASFDGADEPVGPRSIGESVDNWRRRWSRTCTGAGEPGSSQCFPIFGALETGRGLTLRLAVGLGRQVEFRC